MKREKCRGKRLNSLFPFPFSLYTHIMKLECAYSFADLFTAAFGRAPTQDELAALYVLSQTERNAQVQQWAEQAGWGTEDRIGTDGVVYTAFCPLWKAHVH